MENSSSRPLAQELPQRGRSRAGRRGVPRGRRLPQLQAGGEELDMILGDVIWTAKLAVSGWISDRFPESQQQAFLPDSVALKRELESIIQQGKESWSWTG